MRCGRTGSQAHGPDFWLLRRPWLLLFVVELLLLWPYFCTFLLLPPLLLSLLLIIASKDMTSTGGAYCVARP